MSRVWRGCRTALSSLMILLLILLIGYNIYVSAARASGQALPKLFGWSNAVVISGSMRPELEVNDVVIAHEQKEYQAGDVILFREESGKTVCHRIISREADGFVTKGDANSSADQRRVPPGDVHGKVVLVIPRVGVIQEVMAKPWVMALAGSVVALFVFLPYFLRGYKKEEGQEQEEPLGTS